MIKVDLVIELVNKTGVTKTKAERAVEIVFESMKLALARDDRVELRGFGIFTLRPRKTGIARNPRTGAAAAISPGRVIRFRLGKELRSLPLITSTTPPTKVEK
jgi:DNA-binding protein HU-beta